MVEVLFISDRSVIEGQMVLCYNVLVKGEICVVVVCEIGLGEVLKLGWFEMMLGGCCKEVFLVDVMEVVLVVIYLDVGLDVVCCVILMLWVNCLVIVDQDSCDVKIVFQEWVQVYGMGLFCYVQIVWFGLDYVLEFEIIVWLDDGCEVNVIGKGIKCSIEQVVVIVLLMQIEGII